MPAIFLLEDDHGNYHFKCPHCGTFGVETTAFEVDKKHAKLECEQCNSTLEYPAGICL